MSNQIATALQLFIHLIKRPASSVSVEKTPKDLYRYKRKSDIKPDLLMPTFSSYVSAGQQSRGDIELITEEGAKMGWVRAGTGGVSLWDKPVTLGAGRAYCIPIGTLLPSGLAITDDGWRAKWKANHYTIHPLNDMPKDKYILLLKQLEAALVPAKTK